jgi:Peptidase family M1 domain
VGVPIYVTKVPTAACRFGAVLAICLPALSFPLPCPAQAVPQIITIAATATSTHQPGPAESLYLQLSRIGLDPARVFRVRDGALDRPSIHITLEDGTIAFTQDVLGRITGAFFEGDGEVLLIPPNEVERRSMGLFTGMTILEERFSTAYFRFNDNTAAELQPGLRAPEDAQEFISRWDDAARNLAQTDAMRLLETFSEMLPVDGSASAQNSSPSAADRFLHARLQGNKLGIFDVLYNSTAQEQVEAGQSRSAENGTLYYDVWASFTVEDAGQAPRQQGKNPTTPPADAKRDLRQDPILVRDYVIDARVKPPKQLDAEVKLRLDVMHDAARFLVFELSRFLKIQTVEQDGKPVEFVQNPAVEGTQLARNGNDQVAVILRDPPKKGQTINLRFVYGGEVLAEAGNGLLYVGERGMWYPNRGLAMSDYDLTFRYPPGWTLVATGKPVPSSKSSGSSSSSTAPNVPPNAGEEQVTRWMSERPIPVAGFDLGKYVRGSAQAGDVTVEAYATGSVERNFPTPTPQMEPEPTPGQSGLGKIPPPLIAPPTPSPARNATAVAEFTARAIRYYADRFGPFPYSKLALTQLPGRESQGWPGLIFLSSYAFLTREEREEIHMSASTILLDQQVPAHEAAHQWWGDLITWSTYRDQWFSEGLANYCSLMMLEENKPAGFRETMEKYRRDLVTKDKNDNLPKDAGPVTLGSRLLSSHFPEGYQAIVYGRGTWLFHMLRSMLRDAAEIDRKDSTRSGVDEPFVRSLRKLRERYAGKTISTRELLDVFAEDLPPSLRYEGKASLDWFLDGWVNGTSLPRLELQNIKFAVKGNITVVTGSIRQRDAPEDLVTSVPLYAVVAGKAPVLLARVFAEGAETPFRVSAPPGTRKLLLDPQETILSALK